MPALLWAQGGLDVTGRISLRVMNTAYDTTSTLKPDSIADSAYAKTTLIPGLAQSLNIALFARTSKLDMVLLGDLRNNIWDRLNSFKNVSRLSLTVRFSGNEIVLGDFFDSGSELFLQSREVRGARASLSWNQLWNESSYIKTHFSGGQVQKAFRIGERLHNLYHQYETGGQYRRYFASGLLRIGDSNRFETAFKYLYGRDDNTSITESLNAPLTNQVAGGEALLYLWNKHIKLFGENYFSKKDTLKAKNIRDYAYKGGLDFRYQRFKLIAFYQRLGYDYYSAGYPFLQNDRQGLKVLSAYYQPGIATLNVEGELYHDNLNDDADRPTTQTRIGEVGLTSAVKGWPELSVKGRYRDDNSNTILDTVKTQKISRSLESRLSFVFGRNRLSLSAIYIDLADHSVLISGSPLGTSQLVSSINFYTQPATYLFISGGGVFSQLTLTNEQKNTNIYGYLTARWDIIPRRLKLEGNANLILNDAANGGYQDMISDYNKVVTQWSLEYFFNNNISLKLIGGVDRRQMNYTDAEARQVMALEDYGPLFFNSYESYNAAQYGLEMNWIF